MDVSTSHKAPSKTAQINTYWKPFLKHLASQNMLPVNWCDVMLSALAICPTLVMNLRTDQGTHNETSSAIGFYVTALAGSEATQGSNMFTEFFDQIDPAIKKESSDGRRSQHT